MTSDVRRRIDAAFARFAGDGQFVERIDTAPWLDLLEQRFEHRLPRVFAEMVGRYQFVDLECGGVLWFDNVEEMTDTTLSQAPFADPFLSRWLLDHDLMQFGRPDTGSYDPVCLDLTGHRNDPPVVVVDHEDVLLERRKVKRHVVSPSLLNLLSPPVTAMPAGRWP